MNTEVKNLANIDSKSPNMDHSHNSIDKRRKMIENLKQDKLHQLKGTGKILDKIRQQKESLNQRISQSEDKGQLIELLNKQQNLVKKLNHENIELINQNCQFKQQIDSDKELIHSVNQLNSNLNDQNSLLKEQLKRSQEYTIKVNSELKEAKQAMLRMSHKIISKS